ncbi:MAG: hypothetical protein AB7F88_19485 [Pyrinomonadaceae bacterium]
MTKNEINEMMDQLFYQSQIRFGGDAVKSRWFYDGDNCPGCGKAVKAMKFKGKDALSLNAFIYRDHGVLICYLLCGKCAKWIFKRSETDPHGQTELHVEIEKTLKSAYVKKLGH